LPTQETAFNAAIFAIIGHCFPAAKLSTEGPRAPASRRHGPNRFRFLVFPVGRNWRLVLAKDSSQRKSSQKLQFGDQNFQNENPA
jgi:hypothetical protein